MPRGVTEHFVKILRREKKARLKAALGMLALVPFVYFMAEMTDRPLLGRATWVTAGALVVGLVAGGLWGRHRTNGYNESLKTSWNAWMRMSLSSSTVDELDRNVRQKPRRPALAGLVWACFFLLNGILFLALWSDAAWAYAFGILVAAMNGLTVGAVIGKSVWALKWVRDFARALDELVATGAVGMWGEV